MDLNGLWAMISKMVFRSAVDAGVNYAYRRGQPEEEMTPEEREQAKKAREIAARVKQVRKVTRRLWR